MHRCRSSAVGFTLIEVLATLLLVAVVLPVVVRATGMSSQLGVWSLRAATAADLADAKLAELIATGDWESGDQNGEFDEAEFGRDADRYAWDLAVEDYNGVRLQQLTLTVTWSGGGKDRQTQLTTVMRAPDTSTTSTAGRGGGEQ